MLTPLNIMTPAPGGIEAGKSSGSDKSDAGFGALFRGIKSASALANTADNLKEAAGEATKDAGNKEGNLLNRLALGGNTGGGDTGTIHEQLLMLARAIGQKGEGASSVEQDIEALLGAADPKGKGANSVEQDIEALLRKVDQKGKDASTVEQDIEALVNALARPGKGSNGDSGSLEALARGRFGEQHTARRGEDSDVMTRLDERHQQRDSDSPKTASLLSLDGIRSTVETGERLSRQSDNADGDSPEVQQAEAGLMAAPMLLRQGSEGLSTSDRSSRSISATDGSRSISATDGSRSNSQLPGREALLAALKGESSGDETQFSRSSGNTERSGSDRDSQMVAAMMERTTSSRQAALDLQQSGTRSAATTPDAALSALTAQSGQAGSGMMATQGQAVTTATLPSMDSNQWSSALERQTINLGLRGGGEAKLSMSPAELGPLSISLKMGEQGAQLHIGSHSAQVRAAIEAALPQLRDAFSASGIQLGETSVSDQGAFAQQNFQQQGEGSGSGRSGSAAAGMSGSVVAGGNDDIQTLEIPAGRTLSGGIDLFA